MKFNVLIFKYFSILIFLQNLFVIKINSQATLVLNGLIYDNSPVFNIDFESPGAGGVVTGLVLNTLGPDSLPIYCCGSSQTATIHSASTFQSWFNSVPGINLPIPYNLILTKSPTNPNIYTYTNDTFFPIDGQGFGNRALYPNQPIYRDAFGNPHNFHFCLQAHTQFQYKAGDVFNFAGDDDVWVFINNKLVVDLGNIHTKASASVNLDTLGLTVGQNYKFDFFYCERHTVESHIKIETSLQFVCPFYDECGVCQGDGSSCCTVNNCQNNPIYIKNCTQAYCSNNVCVKPPPTCVSNDPCTVGVCVQGTGCVSQPRTCVKENHCTVDFCNSTSNACQHDEIPNCVDCLSIGCITTDFCNVQECSPDGSSCIDVPKTCDDGNYCTIDSCSEGICSYTPIPDCINCPGIGCIQPTDLCTPLVCSADGNSCEAPPFICDDKKYCTTDSCFQGQCSHVPISNCVECSSIGCTTTDFCNVQECSVDGSSCVTVPKNCDNGNICDISSCVSPDGTCSNVPVNCNDQDACTVDSCSPSTGCLYTLLPNCTECLNIGCITTDACFPQTCMDDLSCQSETKICNDGDGCTTDSCISPNGICEYSPVADCVNCNGAGCITTDFCFPMICAPDGSSCMMSDKICDDFDGCTTDSCLSPLGTCQHTMIPDCVNCNGTGCLTQNSCFPAQCDPSGKSCSNPQKSCEDGNFCTTNSCNATDGSCLSIPIDNCITCQSVGCVTDEPCKPRICNNNGDGCITTDKDCDDGNFCTVNICEESDGTCSNFIIAMCINCTNGIGCVTTDLCLPKMCSPDGSSCIEVPLNCDDNDPCTYDQCFDGACLNSPIPNCIPCGFARSCITNSSDFCNPTVCDVLSGNCMDIQKNCDDNDPCTIDTCSTVGCVQETITYCVNCSSTFTCITTDLCQVQECASPNSCQTIDVNCNDNDNCTADTCLVGKQCSNIAIPDCGVNVIPFTIATTLVIPTIASTSTTSLTISGLTTYVEVQTTTGHYTESGTLGSIPHLCAKKNCKKGFKCQIINGHPECLPSNYKCMDCVDLQCHKQGLSCAMVENTQYSSNKCNRHDMSSCCRFTPTCKPYSIVTL